MGNSRKPYALPRVQKDMLDEFAYDLTGVPRHQPLGGLQQCFVCGVRLPVGSFRGQRVIACMDPEMLWCCMDEGCQAQYRRIMAAARRVEQAVERLGSGDDDDDA